MAYFYYESMPLKILTNMDKYFSSDILILLKLSILISTTIIPSAFVPERIGKDAVIIVISCSK